MRIVFFGTPDFAVASLEALLEIDVNVVGVVTATDKYGGRGGKQLIQSAVKKFAVEKEIPVLQPKNLKSKKFKQQLEALAPDLQVIVAFRMLPESVWNFPKLGTINVHGSLLPAYRGAAPIHWAVVNGEEKTGVSTFFLQHKIDTGNIILQKETLISPYETTGDVYLRLMKLGAEALKETIAFVKKNEAYEGIDQDEAHVSHAPKIFTETAEIKWDAPADKNRSATQVVFDHIRGMTPFPSAWTTLSGKNLKVLKAYPHFTPHEFAPGMLIPIAKSDSFEQKANTLGVTTKDGIIELLLVKVAGKKQQSGTDLKNGLRLEKAQVL